MGYIPEEEYSDETSVAEERKDSDKLVVGALRMEGNKREDPVEAELPEARVQQALARSTR